MREFHLEIPAFSPLTDVDFIESFSFEDAASLVLGARNECLFLWQRGSANLKRPDSAFADVIRVSFPGDCAL